MKIRCIDITNCYGRLTKDKIYIVLSQDSYGYEIIDDNGVKSYWLQSRFDIIEYKDVQTPTNPTHYHTKIQPIEFIEANNLGFHEGNVIKYITRYKEKNGIEDLEKAKTYIEMLIKKLKRENV